MKLNFNSFISRIPVAVWLLIAALLSFWQFALYQNGLKWDIQNVMVPWRYFAGECLQHGIFPLWNPYQQFGYPFFADLQYTNWNPEVWIVGNLFGYRYETFYFLIFFYVWMAGLGMYHLSFYLSQKKGVSFFIGLTWMLSGCVSGHLQQFVTVMGIAWMPFVVWQFLAFLDTQQWKNVFGFSAFSFLLMSTGYQALYFLLVYFFAVLLMMKILELWKKDKKLLQRLLVRGTCAILFLVVLFSPIWIAVQQSAPLVSRLDKGVTLDEAQVAPFTPQSLVSLLLPVIAIKWEALIRTDISMSNIFIGCLGLLLVIFSFRKKPNRLQVVLISFAILFLLVSFGKYTPFRKFFYDYIPLMNMFRFPGLFRIAVVLFLLMHTAIYLAKNEISKRWIIIGFACMTVVFALSTQFSYWTMNNQKWAFCDVTNNLFYATEKSSPQEMIFYQSLFFIVLSLLGIAFLLLKKNNTDWKSYIFIQFLFLASATQFNFYRNCGANLKPGFTANWINQNPKGFPLHSEDKIQTAFQSSKSNNCIFSNTGIILKKPATDEFSSFQFKNLIHISDEFPSIRKQLVNYPLAYLSDSVYDFNISKKFKYNPQNNRKISFLNSPITPNNLQTDSSDLVLCKKFEPDNMEYIVINRYPVLFNLQQTFFTGWEILVNDKKADVLINAGLGMSIPLFPGKNHVKFIYNNRKFLVSVSVALFVFFLLMAFFISYEMKKYKFLLFTILCLFPGLAFCLFFRSKNKNSVYEKKLLELIISNKEKNKSTLITADRYMTDENQTPLVIRDDEREHTKLAFRKISAAQSKEFYYHWLNHPPDQKIIDYIQMFFPEQKTKIEKDQRNGYCIFTRKEEGEFDFLKSFSWNHPADSSFFEDRFIKKYFEKNEKDFFCIAGVDNPYGPAFRTNYFKLCSSENKGIRFLFQLKSDAPLEQVLFYVTITDETKPGFKWEQRIDPSAWILKEKNWNPVSISIQPNLEISNTTQIKAYLENGSAKSLFLKDYRIEILKEDIMKDN